MKKNFKKQTKTEFNVKGKVIKKKETNCMSNGKVMIVCLIARLIKMILYKNESIFS